MEMTGSQTPQKPVLWVAACASPEEAMALVAAAAALKPQGCDVELLLPDLPGLASGEVRLIPYRPLPGNWGRMISACATAIHHGLRGRYALVHSHGLFPAGLAGACIGWFFGIPHVVSAASPIAPSRVTDQVLKGAAAVTASSTEDAIALQKLMPGLPVKIFEPGEAAVRTAVLYGKILRISL